MNREIIKVCRERGIDTATAEKLQLEYYEPEGHATAIGIPGAKVPAIGIPYFLPDGTFADHFRTKLLEPYEPKDGKPAKYLQRPGSGLHLYFPPLVDWEKAVADPSIPIIITEGEFKAAKLCQEGYYAVGLGGVDAWQKGNGEDKVPISDLARVQWKPRLTRILFDSDAATNPAIQRAQRALAKHLFGRGADPRIVSLPHVNGSAKTGVDDWFVHNGKRAKTRFEAILASAESPHVLVPQNAADLAAKKFAKKRFAVEALIPEGLVLFSGPPKIGKSFAMLQMGHAVATGGKLFGAYPCNQGTVLYAALEDDPPRLQGRLRTMKLSAPDNLHFVFRDQMRCGDDGVAQLVRWCEDHPDTRLVIIDTLGKFRGASDTRRGMYENDVSQLTAIKNVADRFNVAVVLVHHTRKEKSDDVFDRVSGSTGLAGTADTGIVLVRDRYTDTAYLHLTGRDVIEQERALKFADGIWSDVGEARETRATGMEQLILNALASGGEMKRKDIAAAAGCNANGAFDRALAGLVSGGRVTVVKYGTYRIAESAARSEKF